MNNLVSFPITKKWPAQHPDRIQLYSLPTPNGVKASVMLEETELPYEPHLVDFDSDDQMSTEFGSLNPYNKIPAIIDPDGPTYTHAVVESGAILIYLADKSGKFLAGAGAARYEQFSGDVSGRRVVRCWSARILPQFAGKDMKTSARVIVTLPSRGGCLM